MIIAGKMCYVMEFEAKTLPAARDKVRKPKVAMPPVGPWMQVEGSERVEIRDSKDVVLDCFSAK